VFAQADPIDVTEERLVDPQRLNPYGYAIGNPLKFVDPTGEDFMSWIGLQYRTEQYMSSGQFQSDAEPIINAVSAAGDAAGKGILIGAAVAGAPEVAFAANVALIGADIHAGNYKTAAFGIVTLGLSNAARIAGLVRGGEEAATVTARVANEAGASTSGLAKSGDEVLYRFGTSTETATRLGRKAAEAEAEIGIHGVSVSATAPGPGRAASSAFRSTLEKFFTIHNTPSVGRHNNR
jgi:hypothetical protein